MSRALLPSRLVCKLVPLLSLANAVLDTTSFGTDAEKEHS
jgi:hypothetical protein